MTGGFAVEVPSSGPTSIRVDGESPYDVLIGTDLHDRLPGALAGALRVGLIHPPPLRAAAERLAGRLRDAGLQVHPIEVPDGEAAKTATVLAQCWADLGRAGFTRTDAVVGFGGGSVTDLAGFVAASWLRGVAVVQVPTTLLGMVDAAVGGKTGINTAEGKNLVGAFHPPRAVVCDLGALRTLPAADLVAGLAEVVKCGFIADPVVLQRVQDDPVAARDAAGPLVRELIERAVRVKAEVVGTDLREAGRREILNYGHTLGHAIERAEGFRWRHGDAVSVGMVFAAELGRAAGLLDEATAVRHRQVLGSLGLPTTYAGAFDPLLNAMRVDKKARADRLRFVVLAGLARPQILEAPPEDMLRVAYARLAPS